MREVKQYSVETDLYCAFYNNNMTQRSVWIVGGKIVEKEEEKSDILE